MAHKLKTNTYYFDGQKSIALEQYPDEAWTWITGAPETSEANYFKFIPTLFRAVQLRSQAVSTMPFQIMKGNAEKPYDSSDDWQNKVGFLPNPTLLLQLVEAALTMTGRAYLFRERNQAMTTALRYILPSSVTPQIDEEKGLTGFVRPVKGVQKKYTVEDIVYFFLPDPYVEVGPADNYPAQAAANACGVLLNIDVFAANFFERGAIKAMLLTVKGMPVEAERQKLEAWWKRVVSGVKNAFGAKVINAEAVTPVVVGEGIKELESTTINEEKREDISIALGIPMSILFANAANYATSKQDELNYLTKTVVPECEFIASVLNEQIFTKLGLRFEFLPETLDAFSEDENERAQSLKTLTDAGIPLLMALDLLGFELSDEQRAELEAEKIAKEERAKVMAENLAKQPADEGQPKPDEQRPPMPSPNGNGNNQAAENERKLWKHKALNAVVKGKSADVPFDAEHIPADETERIRVQLASAKTVEDVTNVFWDGTNSITIVRGSDPLLLLAGELRRANDLLERELPIGEA